MCCLWVLRYDLATEMTRNVNITIKVLDLGNVFQLNQQVFTKFLQFRAMIIRNQGIYYKSVHYNILYSDMSLNKFVRNIAKSTLREIYANLDFFRSPFSCIRYEYGELLCKSSYLIEIRKNTDQDKLQILTVLTQRFSHATNDQIYK